MKYGKKILTLILSLSLILTALPLSGVLFADAVEASEKETVTYNFEAGNPKFVSDVYDDHVHAYVEPDYSIVDSAVDGDTNNKYLTDKTAYINTLNRLKQMDIKTIICAHDYEPCGYLIKGKENITDLSKVCEEVLI